MAAILAILSEIAGLVSSILGIVSSVLGIVGTTAQETGKYAIERIAAAAANTVNSPTFGNAALLTEIQAVNAQVIAAATSLTLQITDLTDGTTPVSLPVVPPTGYGGPTSSAVANDVWNWNLSPLYSRAKEYLAAAGNWSAFSANLRWLGDEVKYFEAVYGGLDYTAGASDWVPAFDPTDILSTEDALTCLTRQNPGWTVTWSFAPDGYVRLEFPGTAEIQKWQTTFDQTGFAAIKSQLFPLASAGVPPMWPGLANVTLGTPVAIAPQMTVSGPMDGVIVTITSVSVSKPSIPYDTELAYKFIGALAFVSDNGDVETFQALAFTHALYCPERMTRAASVVVKADPSLTGTVTPWVTV
jgi:hypothetical protein